MHTSPLIHHLAMQGTCSGSRFGTTVCICQYFTWSCICGCICLAMHARISKFLCLVKPRFAGAMHIYHCKVQFLRRPLSVSDVIFFLFVWTFLFVMQNDVLIMLLQILDHLNNKNVQSYTLATPYSKLNQHQSTFHTPPFGFELSCLWLRIHPSPLHKAVL